MLTRHSIFAAAMLCVFAPALAQDTGSAPFWPSPMRATGAYPVRQDATQWLGSNLIGAKVLSVSNQAIGRVSDLVVNDDGAVEAAVITIAGAFGLARKDVAVTYKSLNIVRTRAGDAVDHVTLAATKDDLRHAAEFKTLTEQKAEKQARRSPDMRTMPAKLTTPAP
jgi:hypothetical protein